MSEVQFSPCIQTLRSVRAVREDRLAPVQGSLSLGHLRHRLAGDENRFLLSIVPLDQATMTHFSVEM